VIWSDVDDMERFKVVWSDVEGYEVMWSDME